MKTGTTASNFVAKDRAGLSLSVPLLAGQGAVRQCYLLLVINHDLLAHTVIYIYVYYIAIYLFIYSFMYLFRYLFINVCIHLFTYLYLFVQSFIYSYCDNSQLFACFKTGSILWYDEVPSHASSVITPLPSSRHPGQ